MHTYINTMYGHTEGSFYLQDRLTEVARGFSTGRSVGLDQTGRTDGPRYRSTTLIFEALHLMMCYLFHHPHLPIMYSSKKIKSTAAALQTHWQRGFAEYLSSDFGDGLASFADADFARDLCSRRSISAHFQLLNGVNVT
jgi:hypothetical protein